MERPSDEFENSSLPEPSNEESPAFESESTSSSDQANELNVGGEPNDEPEEVFDDAGTEENEVESTEAVTEQPAEPLEPEPEGPFEEPAAEPTPELVAAEPTPEPVAYEPSPEPVAAEVSPELVAAVDEAFVDTEVALPEGESEEDDVLLDWQPGQWFVVHTYAGYENKVKTNLESRIISMNMEEKIYEVVIPTEDVMEVKSGKKQVVQKKVFPGYLLVRMDLDDDSWYVVRNTPGVTGFVGSGTKPIPLSEKEVDRVLQRKGPEERPKPRLEFTAGDGVRVVTGPFANFQGVISDIDVDRSKLKVLVNIFGRETPVELGFDQVAKI